MTATEPWVWLARIRRPQGRKGEVFAEILTDFPEKFADRKHLWLIREGDSGIPDSESKRLSANSAAPRAVELRAHWLHKGGVVLHFAGIDSISAAETLVGLGVAIPQSERAQLSEGETYIADLIGCTLIDVAGTEPAAIGKIEDVDTTAGPISLLIVHAVSKNYRASESANQPHQVEEILIPFVQSYLRHIDIEAKRVEMALPEGLVDLNASR
jgi:16S rRNA processing protein RimM